MNILVLEDNLERIKRFKRELIGHTVTYTEYAAEAKQLILEKKFDLIFLDHDLGGEQYCASGIGTGYEAACAIDGGPNADTYVIVHSCNPVGAQSMMQVISSENKARIPFTALNIKREVDSFL